MLGKLNLNVIPIYSREITQIEVTFNIDANIILNASAIDKITSKNYKIIISND
jgi:molecular chaperone DnaK (HSP70)